MLGELQMFWRFARGLRGFLQSPLSDEQSRELVAQSLQNREKIFLLLLRRAVFAYAQSPYLALLHWAGVAYGDIERMVHADGIEAAMERLFDAGVYVDLEEFKGRRPIERSGFSLDVKAEDFDNPLLAHEFEVESGGSTGARRRMKIDFALLEYDAACRFLSFAAFGAEDRALATWKGVPPDSSGMKHALCAAKIGRPMERWFSPTPVSWHGERAKFAMVTNYAVHSSRLWGGRLPAPEHVPLSDARPVARWLAEKVRQGQPGLLSAAANNVVRACVAAREEGLDIAGSLFRVSGEPFSEAKHRLVAELGTGTFSGWSMSETGPLGGGCANREAIDEVHLFSGKLAVFQRPKRLEDGESVVDALYLTTTLPATPKIMLNLDSGDYGVLSERRCGCSLEQAGLRYHLHTIRNYEKLTAGGIHLVGSDFIRLLEEVLPTKYGGLPTDYQLVEEQDGALTSVSILVSPRVGGVDEGSVVATVIKFLSSQNTGNRAMLQLWEQGRTLRVVRREPYVTPASKTPHVRVLRK